MKRRLFILTGMMALAVLTASLIWGRAAVSKRPVAAAVPSRDWVISGPGKVEPGSENIKLAAELNGKLKRILVEEGDTISAGQVLAELQNSDYQAQVESAQAEVKQREAELRKVINGARSEERRQAMSTVREAEAVMRNAETEMIRRQKLYTAGVIAREEADRAAKEFDVAKARYEERVQNHALLDETAREEDRSLAEARLQSARARLDEVRALLAKTFVRSPIDGTVLRKHHRAGESVSNGSSTPDPIFTIGDKRALRVRVDVDEADISKLALGQKAYVTADAYGDRRFWGHVVQVGQELGRKNVRTDEPTERVDTKVLESLIQLEPGTELPVGLRVNSFIVEK